MAFSVGAPTTVNASPSPSAAGSPPILGLEPDVAPPGAPVWTIARNLPSGRIGDEVRLDEHLLAIDAVTVADAAARVTFNVRQLATKQ